MADVIQLDERRPGVWVVAHAICLDCRHTWVAVADAEHTHLCRLECPACGGMCGVGVVVPTRRADDRQQR